jgi:DNA-binding response OmpR family regulator
VQVTAKVLVIDEQSNISDETFVNLKKEGFKIHCVHTEQNYVNAVMNIKPDVIIVDAHQPDRRENRFFQSIRSVSQAPILVLSVIESPGIVEKVLDLGADEYLLKPVSPTLLAARLKALARRSHSANHYHNSH